MEDIRRVIVTSPRVIPWAALTLWKVFFSRILPSLIVALL
jgi:hypothetical protein